MVVDIQSLRGSALSILPSGDIIAAFLLLNICAFCAVKIRQKWKDSSSKGNRSSSPDLEKPASKYGRGKVTRNPGGMIPMRIGIHGKNAKLMQSGHHQTSRDLLLLLIQTGMFIPPSLSPTAHFAMARK